MVTAPNLPILVEENDVVEGWFGKPKRNKSSILGNMK